MVPVDREIINILATVTIMNVSLGLKIVGRGSQIVLLLLFTGWSKDLADSWEIPLPLINRYIVILVNILIAFNNGNGAFLSHVTISRSFHNAFDTDIGKIIIVGVLFSSLVSL